MDLKRAIDRVEILKVNVHDDQLRFKMQVQEQDKLIDEVEESVQCVSVQHDMPGM